jgi:hypothetical protein
MEGEVVTLQDLFVCSKLRAADGVRDLLGPLVSAGLKPHFLAKMAANAVELPPDFFAYEAA